MRKQKTEELKDFSIPLGKPSINPAAVFASLEFQKVNVPDDEPIVVTEADKAWAEKTAHEGKKTTPAPSLAAERYLRTHFAQYNFDMPATQGPWRNFVLSKLLQQANDPDYKVSKPALDTLAKTSVVGLMDQKVDVSITHQSSEELTHALQAAIKNFRQLKEEKVITGEAKRVS